MKKIFVVLIAALFCLGGCVTTHEYKGNNNFPPLTSTIFPSYPIDSPIIEEVEVKLPEGMGITKIKMSMSISKGSKSIKAYSNNTWTWNIKYEDKTILNKGTLFMNILEIGKRRSIKRKQITMDIDSIHDTKGNELKMDVTFRDKVNEFTIAQLNDFKRDISNHIYQLFASTKNKIKTGDIIKDTPNKLYQFRKMSQANGSKSTIPLKVKGWGTYKYHKVIVTEIVFDESIKRPDLIIEARGKGYYLYDKDSFILRAGKAVAYGNIFSPKEGTIEVIIDMNFSTDGLLIHNTIDPTTLTD